VAVAAFQIFSAPPDSDPVGEQEGKVVAAAEHSSVDPEVSLAAVGPLVKEVVMGFSAWKGRNSEKEISEEISEVWVVLGFWGLHNTQKEHCPAEQEVEFQDLPVHRPCLYLTVLFEDNPEDLYQDT
jgi:hypothetical protein